MNLLILLYADDTVIFAESESDLQKSLNVFEEYCDHWKLSVNIKKTKIMIFSKRKVDKTKYKFRFADTYIEIVDYYNYLGLNLNCNGTFKLARTKLIEQANKALFVLYKKIRNISLPIDIQLKLFDQLIQPILLYGCEIWGYENIMNIERVHLGFCKRILGVRSTTPNFMVYGELGRVPLETIVQTRMITFWYKLLSSNKLSSKLYNLTYALNINNKFKYKWLTNIKKILDSLGLSFIFNDQNKTQFNLNWLKSTIKTRLKDQFVQSWTNSITNSSRGQFYILFKQELKFESYLTCLRNPLANYMTKLRTCNIKIPYETGRWSKTPRDERICQLCNADIGNEFHYLFICPQPDLVNLRTRLIPRYYTMYPNETKMGNLMSITYNKIQKNLSIFIKNLSKYL